MKISGKRQDEKSIPVRVQIMMLEKNISRALIIKKLKISKSLLSKALKGKRKGALERVARFVDSFKQQE